MTMILKRVLLVEPPPSRPGAFDIAAALGNLRAGSYEVTPAYTLVAAIEKLSSLTKASAVLLDLNLPDSEGLATFLRFQSKSDTRPIIVLVDRAQEDLGNEAVKRGALDYLLREELTASLIDRALRLAFERTHTVLALRASEARYRTLFESSAAGVYQASCDDRLITVNPAFIRMLGYATEQEVLALEVGRDIFANAEDHAAWRRDLASNDESGEPTSRETTLRKKNGDRLVVMHNARLVRDSRDVPLYYEGTITDVTAAHHQARQWSYEASHDALTGLLNRREVERRLSAMLENAAIDRSTLALLVIDLDGFKAINDQHGHGAGDDVLRHVASVLKQNARGGDLIARLGGDEFVMALEHCTESEATKIAEKVLAALKTEACLWAGRELPIRASIGIAISSPTDTTPSQVAWTELLEHADLACYDAKGRTGNQARPYRDDGTAIVRISKARRLAAAIEHALETGTLRLAARPIVPLQGDDARAHSELLARLPKSAAAAAAASASAASAASAAAPTDATGESTGFESADLARIATQDPSLAQRIDRWAIATAFRWIAKNHRSTPNTARWFVNLSAASLEDATLLAYIEEQLRATRAPAMRIGFEIDESALNEHFYAASALLPKLRKLNFECTLDGFGRGVSSFAYLKALDVSYVKIDLAALQSPGANDKSGAAGALELLGSLHKINRTLGRRTIVQSLNDADLAPTIVRLGIDYAQGSALRSLTAAARASRSG